jgi:hypothetical protein
MSQLLAEEDWEVLISRIKAGKCTPFLGAGACAKILPLAADIAREWASNHNYPMEDIDDLGNVAQYLAITRDPVFPKEKISEMLQSIYPDDFKAIENAHGLLAKLPLPTYVTTNYDNFMFRALLANGKQPNRILCQWNAYCDHKEEYILKPEFEPSPSHPLVFHLHGVTEVPESLVLTEDDYVDFLVNVSRDQNTLIPPQIQLAITGSSLLFIGYSLRDWNFRVVFRGLVSQMPKSLRRDSVAVQLPKGDEYQEEYLNKYFADMNIKVFWGNSDDFLKELKSRWEAYDS